MLERRPLFGLLIALTLCVSIWRISLQESPITATEVSQQSTYYHYRVYPQSEVQTQQEEKYSLHYSQSQQQEQLQYQPQNTLTSSSWTSAAATPAPPYTYTPSRGNLDGGGQLRVPQSLFGDIRKRNVNNTNPPIWSTNNSSYNTMNALNNNLSLSNYNVSVVSTPASSIINYEMLPKDDLNTLIDMHDFEFIMNQSPCNSENRESRSHNPVVLVLVHSAPTNFNKRYLIRETWGSVSDPSFRLIFLLGAVNSTELQQTLEQENFMFSDMVQGNFIDAYRNMTYKHVMALKWFTYFCPGAKYVLKIDDDVFVNTPYLLKYLQTTADRQDLLFCQKITCSMVKRSYRSKWRVSTKEYPGRYYPPYCPGYSIIYSPDVAFRLYIVAQRTPYFWIDDVHVTGTLSQQANITITSFMPFILKNSDCENILAGKTDINSVVFLFSWPDIKENQTRSLWNLVRDIR